MNFRQEFVALAKDKNWMAAGFFDRDGNFHKFNTDSKTISSNFEIMTTKYVRMIAAKFGYTVERSVQTRYPDFNLIKPGCPHIAVDIKTTYRRPNTKIISYTLGTYKIYQGSKAIHFPLHEYGEHWVIGFLYDRLPDEDEYPYDNVEYFVQEKHKISGMGNISGNTTNIISFRGSIQDFRAGIGPLSSSYQTFFDYWAAYVPKNKR